MMPFNFTALHFNFGRSESTFSVSVNNGEYPALNILLFTEVPTPHKFLYRPVQIFPMKNRPS